jgi:hypothetical protein
VGALESNVGALESNVGRASAYITETWNSGTSWYRKYSDGWVEQGGFYTSGNNLVFHTPFSNTDYVIVCCPASGSSSQYNASTIVYQTTKTTTTVTVSCRYNGAGNSGIHAMWYACGY